MLWRVGGLLVVTGLTLALFLGDLFAALGGFLIVGGAVVLALAGERILQSPVGSQTDQGALGPE